MMMVNEVIAELNFAAKSSGFLYPCRFLHDSDYVVSGLIRRGLLRDPR
jgi:hypothetical protein